MNTRIKICGITYCADALRAVEFGADALGFIFYHKSPRAVTIRQAAKICAALPPFVARVGVFVNESAVKIERALRACRLTALQFHGDEGPAFCRKFAAQAIKAIHVRDENSLRAAAEYDVDALVLDTYTAAQRGGTGRVFDWSLAVKAREMLRQPIILSGGLTPGNVAEAVRVVQPYAVDVASGVESRPGRKDPKKLRSFIEAVRARA